MGIIRQLSKDVIERIAAGEVVERPASVVKELVENSIDAGAGSISIDVGDGGKGRMSVADDGSGMEPDDLAACMLRHSTSKICSEEDLWNIRTMGFRGEALAAISAVAKVTIESRINRPDVLEGARIEVEGGSVRGPIVVGCAGGTRVVVSDLFFNVPARQKFLRSAAVEYGHVADVVANLSLAFPNIRFELSSDGRRKFLSRSPDPMERALAVVGEDARGRLLPVDERGDVISIRGWVAREGRAGGKDVHVFLNGRPLRDRLLMHAASSGFDGRMGKGEYPIAILWMEIDTTAVDVNVHPAKREVRFSNSRAVHDFVSAAIRKAVCNPGIRPQAASCELRAASLGPHAGSHELRATSFELNTGLRFAARSSEPAADTNLRPLGQIDRTYIVCEDQDSTLVLIDQHAAHERLGFDSLTRHYAEGNIPQQRLLIPERVELGPKELAYVMEHLDLLSRAGFEIEPFGGGTLIVKAVPSLLSDTALTPLFEELAIELEELGNCASIDQAVEKIFALIACHRQVRAGDALSQAELSALVADVERENVTHCPHGRPAIVRIEKGEIEKWFKRR